MAIKKKDGSTYSLNKPPPAMEEQSFWNKKEPIIFHNKYGQRYLREKKEADEVILPKREVKVPVNPTEDEIKIVQAIEESKPKQLSEDVVDVWCLPCVKHIENVDPLYDESYDKFEYGSTFTFRARLLILEDLEIQFVVEKTVELPNESVIFPKTASRRWWRVKAMREVKEFKIYLGIVSDYQPSFE